jgi:hypothetical protein
VMHVDVYVPPSASMRSTVLAIVASAERASKGIGDQFRITDLVGDRDGGAIGTTRGVRTHTPACPLPIYGETWIRDNDGDRVWCSLNGFYHRTAFHAAVSMSSAHTKLRIRVQAWD